MWCAPGVSMVSAWCVMALCVVISNGGVTCVIWQFMGCATRMQVVCVHVIGVLLHARRAPVLRGARDWCAERVLSDVPLVCYGILRGVRLVSEGRGRRVQVVCDGCPFGVRCSRDI